MTPAEIYSKLMDRYLELNKKACETLSNEDIIYQRGFREAVQMLYDFIRTDSDESWLKEGENE